MRGIDFKFECVNLLRYKQHEKNLKRGALYLDFPDCIKIKKAVINPMNDGKYFQYAPTIALNQKEIGKNLPFKN